MIKGFSLDRVSFELGTEKDLFELNRICAERGDYCFGGIAPPERDYVVQNKRNGSFIVARLDNKQAIGFATFSLKDRTIFIDRIALLDEYSGVLGRVLLKKVESVSTRLFMKLRHRPPTCFELNPAFVRLRHKVERGLSISKGAGRERNARLVRGRWFASQGYLWKGIERMQKFHLVRRGGS